jgi:hypothetical protein
MILCFALFLETTKRGTQFGGMVAMPVTKQGVKPGTDGVRIEELVGKEIWVLVL